jgi:hypothetical protein
MPLYFQFISLNLECDKFLLRHSLYLVQSTPPRPKVEFQTLLCITVLNLMSLPPHP